MPNLNTITISGNLTRDPKHIVTDGGAKITTFSLAHNDRYKTKDGEWKDKVCYIDIVTLGRLAVAMAEKLHKGSPVVVEGKLQLNTWTGKSGAPMRRHEILSYSVQAIEKTGGYEEPPVDSYVDGAPEEEDGPDYQS